VNVLVGTGSGTRAALARAALLQDGAGRPTLAGDLLDEAARRHRRRDTLDVILVARSAAQALFVRVPGLAVAGVVAEEEASFPLPEDVSVVTGTYGALDAVPEGEWVIVDPVRGRVLIAPDAAAVARAQAEAERPRVLLGAAHQPARTQQGAEVAVWAAVRSEGDLEEAMKGGADGVFVPAPGGLLPALLETPDMQERRLLRAAESVGGGPVGLYAPPELLDPLAVVGLAARCQACWFLHPGELPLEIAAFREELRALVAEELDADRPARMPRLAAALPVDGVSDTDRAGDLAAYDEALLVWADSEPRHMPGLASAAFARGAGLPLRAWLPDDLETHLPPALAHGVAGIIVEPHRISEAKNLIRVQE
jgi:phosphohistidine swiveling domain-containing protein